MKKFTRSEAIESREGRDKSLKPTGQETAAPSRVRFFRFKQGINPAACTERKCKPWQKTERTAAAGESKPVASPPLLRKK